MMNHADPSSSTGLSRLLGNRSTFIAIVLSLFLIQMVSHSVLIGRGTQFIVTQLTIDDTYYYLETAWNHKTAGFPTFDGFSRTNGFHFLWYLIVYLVALLVQSKYLLLRYAMGICAFFMAAPYLFFYLISRKLRSIMLGLFLSIIWFAAHLGPQDILIGLENSLHLLVSTWILYEVICLFVAIRDDERVHLFRLTAALAVNAYCRVDSGLLSAVVFALSLTVIIRQCGSISEFRRKYGKIFLLSMSFAVLAGIVQFSAYMHWNDTLIPISGIIKVSNVFPPTCLTFLSEVIRIFTFSLPKLPLSLMIQIIICLAVLYLSLRRFRVRRRQYDDPAMSAFMVLLVSNLVYMIYLCVSPGTVRPYWYYSPVNVFWIFSLSLLLTRLNSLSMHTRLRRSAHAATAVFIALMVASGVQRYRGAIIDVADPHSMFAVRYRTALWIRDSIPEDVVLAAWNAGQVGFFSEHSVINLDGLINSRDYFESVLLGRASLFQYLRRNNVRYLVDYRDATEDQFTHKLSVFRSFLVTNSVTDSLYIWDLESIDPDSDIGYYPGRT